MTKTEYVNDLIERLGNENLRPGLSLPEGVKYQSTLTISHEARIEAYQLADPHLIEPLKVRLQKEKVTITRINIIQLLISIANKVKDHSIADYILAVVRLEKVRWIRHVALRSLVDSELEIQNEKEYLFELVQHKDWQIKLYALRLIRELDSSYSLRIEQVCLPLLQSKTTKANERSACCSVLARHGTQESLRVLKELARTSNDNDFINSVISAIAGMNTKEELVFFREIYEKVENSKSNDLKFSLTSILCRLGDESIMDLLFRRATKILSRQRNANVIYLSGIKPELVQIFEFLIQHKNTKVEKFLDVVKNKKYAMMDETEKKWFDTQITFV